MERAGEGEGRKTTERRRRRRVISSFYRASALCGGYKIVY